MSMIISYAKDPLTRVLRAAQPAEVALAAGTQYALTLKNESNQSWIFYVYQKAPQPSANVFSLAWFCSPFQIRVGNHIQFIWEINYNFVWSATGELIPGVDFNASGTNDCSPSGDNTTDFNMVSGPGLSDPYKGPPAGSLVINDGGDVPASTFSVGIGMSGTGSFAVQAGPSLTHTFTPTPSYWIAGGQNVKIGTVLNIDTITPTAEVTFPANVFDRTYALNGANQWVLR